ncbi:MAG: molybdopterin molybdotransferase MoeA [Nitrospirae bacterium]|nr:molybdopterin molybdotransferase MoeA [Nitrospirota bacterium]
MTDVETKKMEPWREALEKFLAAFPEGPISRETVDLRQAAGRVSAGEVPARTDIPPFSQALMEGVLVYAADTDGAAPGAPVGLEIAGKIEAGAAERPSLSPGKGLEVFTGSLLDGFPPERVAVVPFRELKKEGNRIAVERRSRAGENIELRGKELRTGATLIPGGKRLGPAEIGLLAGQGILQAAVAGRQTVALFSSGNEVLPPSEPIRPGCVRDANSYALSAAVTECGGIPRFYGIMKDDLEGFTAALRRALGECDMAVIAGGTLAGGKPFIEELVRAMGHPGIVINGVPMRSGKPLIMGVAGTQPIVCVAGYPPEALRGFGLFGRPAIARLLGER